MLRTILSTFAACFVLTSVNVSAESFQALPPFPITPGVSTHFGGAVAISGPTIAVGSVTDCCEAYFDNGAREGFVFLYRYANGVWVHQTTLSAPFENLYNGFGTSVSVSGDFLVVGAPHQGATGKAFVYRYDGASWGQARELNASDPAVLYKYGSDVAIVGDVAVVGTGSSETGESRQFVFRFNGQDWINEAVLSGVSVIGFAVLEDMILLGSYGGVSVYRHEGAAWVDAGELPMSSNLGVAHVTAAENVAVVSFLEPLHRSPSARVYHYNGTEWREEEILDGMPYDETDQGPYGYDTYATDGNRIVVGSPWFRIDGYRRGKITVYERGQFGWAESASYTAGELDAHFATTGFDVGDLGIAVAVSGPVTVMGAFAAAFVVETPISTGTHCALSGSWFNPAQPGHGWVIEEAVNPSGPDKFVSYYYGYEDGQQVWLIGVGPGVAAGRAEVEMVRTGGSGWGSEFNPVDVEMNVVGTMSFEFSDCDHGRVIFEPADTALAEFSTDFVRLTRISTRRFE